MDGFDEDIFNDDFMLMPHDIATPVPTTASSAPRGSLYFPNEEWGTKHPQYNTKARRVEYTSDGTHIGDIGQWFAWKDD